jgi:hypothetical protein
MAQKWQQWMPFHINRFKASSAVQAMHPAARSGYWYLLSAAWESEDCALSPDPFDLAEKSGLGDELWAIYSIRILRNFITMPDGRLRNQVSFEEWCEAKRIFEARQESAKRTNQIRPAVVSAGSQEDKDAARKSVTEAVRKGNILNANQVPCVDCGHLGDDRTHDWDHYKGYSRDNWLSVQSVCRPCHTKREISRGTRWKSEAVTVTATVTEEPPLRSADTITLTGTITTTEEQVQQQKPSAKKKTSRGTMTEEIKSRHAEFKGAIEKYWLAKNTGVEMPWGPAEGRNLAMWLKESPTTTVEQFTFWLRNRFKSEVNHTERPSRWITNVTNFAAGPIDRFGKSLGSNGGKNAAVPSGKTDSNMVLSQELIDEDQYRSRSSEDGVVQAGAAKQDGPPTLLFDSGAVGHAGVSGGNGYSF